MTTTPVASTQPQQAFTSLADFFLLVREQEEAETCADKRESTPDELSSTGSEHSGPLLTTWYSLSPSIAPSGSYLDADPSEHDDAEIMQAQSPTKDLSI